jgi:hypothetical protein
MGGFSAQVQQPTNPPQAGGKGIANQVSDAQYRFNGAVPQGGGDGLNGTGLSRGAPQPMAKGGNYQSNVTSGQPRMGQRNMYPNTVGQWDNAQIQPVRQQGKGKGA